MLIERHGEYYLMHHKGLVGVYNRDRYLVETIDTNPDLALKPGSIPIRVEPVKSPTPMETPEPVKEPVKV